MKIRKDFSAKYLDFLTGFMYNIEVDFHIWRLYYEIYAGLFAMDGARQAIC